MSTVAIEFVTLEQKPKLRPVLTGVKESLLFCHMYYYSVTKYYKLGKLGELEVSDLGVGRAGPFWGLWGKDLLQASLPGL